MASRLSRRVMTQYVAGQLLDGNQAVIAQLAAYLIETRRTNEADLVVADIETELMQAGLVIADITSARELTDDLRDVMTAYVQKVSGAHEVQVRTNVDPLLIGGVRVRTPDAEYDASVRRQLKKIQAMKV